MVDLSADLAGYFQELLTTALKSLELSPAAATERYLTNLLVACTYQTSTPDLSTPLVEQLASALEASTPERVQRMRGLGDAALFMSGFASEAMPRRGLTKSYCCSLGSRAYWEASRGQSPVLQELAQRFEAFSEAFDEVREQTCLHTSGSILRQYERWMDSSSPELLRRLTKNGLAPQRKSILGN